jgi:hypothetical protein
MRSLGNGDYLDDSGRLYITTLGEFDPFAPINQETPQVIKATPFTFEDVPTTGLWSVIYRNNPLHFASHATAEAMAKRIASILDSKYWVEVVVKEMAVGPFRRGPQRDIRVTRDGKSEDFNAGREAHAFAKWPGTYPAELLQRVQVAGL